MMEDLSGLILLDKPPGITSFKILGEIKKKAGNNKSLKLGHAGTLDKFAAGLLIVLAGRFTKLNYFFTNLDKEYTAVICFGNETDTLDTEGRVIASSSHIPDIEKIEKNIKFFTGKTYQKPPVYSAIHINGKRAYKTALEGKKIEMPEREIYIKNFRVISYIPPCLKVSIKCSKGTYIRSIARDLGIRCNSRAYLTSLIRNSIGSFNIAEAVKPSNLNLPYDLRNSVDIFSDMKGIYSCSIKKPCEKLLIYGKKLDNTNFLKKLKHDGNYAVFNEEGRFLRIISKYRNLISYKIMKDQA